MDKVKEMVREINGVTYHVSTHYSNSEVTKDTAVDKITRLIQQEVKNKVNNSI